MKADFNVFKMLTIRAGLEQKIGPGIFLVQAAHQHFELYIYSRRTCTGPIVRRPTGKMPGMPDYQSSPAYDVKQLLVELLV